LVVESRTRERSAIVQWLLRQGHSVQRARDARSLARISAASGEGGGATSADLLITSAGHKPGYEGLRLARELRQSRPELRCLLFADADRVDNDFGEHLGDSVDAFLHEPLDVSALAAAVDRLLAAPRQPPPPAVP